MWNQKKTVWAPLVKSYRILRGIRSIIKCQLYENPYKKVAGKCAGKRKAWHGILYIIWHTMVCYFWYPNTVYVVISVNVVVVIVVMHV